MYLYYRNYLPFKNSKIEILNGNIYINCYTYGKFIRGLEHSASDIPREKFILFIKELINLLSKQYNMELNEKEIIELRASKMYHNDECISKHPHYSYIQDNVSLHSTSNINFDLHPSQILGNPMLSMITHNAINPGTVITTSPDIRYTNSKMPISKREVELFMYSHPDKFKLSCSSIEYIYEKQYAIDSVVLKYYSHSGILNSTLISHLRSNLYTDTLINLNDSNISDGYDTIKDSSSI